MCKTYWADLLVFRCLKWDITEAGKNTTSQQGLNCFVCLLAKQVWVFKKKKKTARLAE